MEITLKNEQEGGITVDGPCTSRLINIVDMIIRRMLQMQTLKTDLASQANSSNRRIKLQWVPSNTDTLGPKIES